ncbi:unnamed protein product [Linum tenue]|uniref:ABC transporter domain-containing protein n=1 Tax=Linum tenue TaxID=586396 RepID=A0AAV0Q6E1_9ROSI|nr:unnamed protein product [Linum tenue]
MFVFLRLNPSTRSLGIYSGSRIGSKGEVQKAEEVKSFNRVIVRQVLAGLLHPSGGTFDVKRPKSYVFQNPDHQRPVQTLSGGQKQRVACNCWCFG